jgi:hyperosmotically inducible periplasmic protein
MQRITVSASVALLLLVSGISGTAQTPAAQQPAGQQAPATQPTPGQQDRTLAKVISDSWITMKVHSLFIPEDALENSNIDVDTRTGVVSLSGTVATEAGKNRAVEIARMTDGVKSVTSTALRVAPETVGTAGRAAQEGRRAGRTVNDGWIKSKIYAQFLTEDALNDSNIDVDIANGMVTLNGTVRTQAGSARAEALAKATEGVKGVKNNTKVVAQ